jgi:amino acid adenylation domain-containing protein
MMTEQFRDLVSAEELLSQKSYWLNQLSGELPETNFIPDYIRPAISSKQKSIDIDLSESLSKRIFKFTNSSDFSIYLLLLSVLAILLQKYNGSNDIIVGSPIYNLDIIEKSTPVVPLRFALNNQLKFPDFLLDVKKKVISAYSHPDYYFDKLVNLLKLPQNPNRCPVFDIVILLENIHNPNNLTNINNDLTFSFLVTDNLIKGKINYNEEIFQVHSLQSIVKYYINILEVVTNNFDIALADISLLGESDRHQILAFNSNFRKQYPFNQTIDKLFEQQVEQTPNHIAATFANSYFTYQELNQKANQLAQFLQSLGVKPGDFIGIFKERDTNFLLGILAILKAGGVYVPIDSTYPPDRIEHMLSNSEVKIVLTDSLCLNTLLSLLNSSSHLQYIACLDIKPNIVSTEINEINIYDQSDFDNLSSENLGLSSTGIAPAYMMYTSGSTGLPKGAIIRHNGAINHIWAQFDALNLSEGFSFLQSAPVSSDISVWQFLAPILIGGKTVIVNRETVYNPENLFQVIKSEKLVIVELVPAALKSLLDYISGLSIHQRLLPNLQWMMVTGESVSVELVNRWLSMYPSIRVVNAYGPTEAADDVTGLIIEKPLPSNLRTVPIGKPLANLNLYILNQNMQLSPIGVPGEICVSGIGVGQGYWKNEKLTQLSFVANPFQETQGSYLYKTGDLGRWLPDGNIEFLGRIDHQVKIRGFRIELGEIEVLISQHPQVRETIVVVKEDTCGDKRLVGYVVLSTANDANSSELANELRNLLKLRLPEHMIPSAFVQLEALPLLPNGKVNRRALPVPFGLQQPQHNYASPRTPIEEMIAGIWSQVLGVEQVGVDDNFFDLGGHSLLATLVISKLRNVFHIELPLRNIFDFPTVATLAESVQTMRQSRDNLQSLPIVPIPRNGKEPLSFAQQRLWFIDQLEPNNTAYNHFHAVRIIGSLHIVALEQSLNEIIKRHEVLRSNFPAKDGQPSCAIAPALSLELPVVDLQIFPENEREAEVLRQADREVEQPFNLAKGLLLRVKLLKLGATEHILLLTIHHIIFDGWSGGVLTKEIVALYEAFSCKKPSPLPELSIQYADFAYWQRQWLQGKTLETQLSYWQKQLTNAPTSLDLHKIAISSSSTTKTETTNQSFLLSPSLSEHLKKLSRQQGVTLFMVLLAIFQTLLYRYTNQDDIVVGTDVANRNRSEIEPLIGFFVNLLVLRTDLSGNPSFQELLGRVREVTLGAYAHQDLPFAKLVEVLQPDRTSSYTPLFQVLFVLQNAPISALEFSDLTLSPLEINIEKSKFNLALFMEETEQGIIGVWKYNPDLFHPGTINTILNHFQTLVSSIVTQPDAKINSLEILTEAEKREQIIAQEKRETASFKKFKSIKPKAVVLPQTQLVKTDYLHGTIPLVVQPNVDELDLAEWAKNHREFIEAKLLTHGAILFRGFNLNLVAEFENFAQGICSKLFGEYGDLPREGISGKVYSSTPYPSDQAILFHNESSHLHQWPLKIWFFCVQPAQQGGETPIVDCRRVYQMLNPKLQERFEKKQLMYVRNYIQGLDVNWQEFFHTTDKKIVEQYCRQAAIGYEWLENNGLKTRLVRSAVTKHPRTGETVFFNQLQLHHILCLEPSVRASLLSMFGEENLPRNVYYGDGSPIEDSVIEEITAVYQKATISFPWQQGDILMLDNMLTAHGRNPYLGPRKIVVAMGEIIQMQ